MKTQRKRPTFQDTRRNDRTLSYTRQRYIEGVKFSGHSQIDVLVTPQVIDALGNPPALMSYTHEDGSVRILAAFDGGYKVRRTGWSSIISSLELARHLWRLNPQGRFFDVSSIVGPTEAREAVITHDDVAAVYTYHRFEPGRPFLSAKRNQEAGEEFDRTGKMPMPQYSQSEDSRNEGLRTVERPASTEKSPKNDLTEQNEPHPRMIGYESMEALNKAIEDALDAGKGVPPIVSAFMQLLAQWNEEHPNSQGA